MTDTKATAVWEFVMTDTKATKRRLERAGYQFASGWFLPGFAARVKQQAEMHKPDVAAIQAQPPKPRGRPKKETRA
jgi:hypothetical protein